MSAAEGGEAWRRDLARLRSARTSLRMQSAARVPERPRRQLPQSRLLAAGALLGPRKGAGGPKQPEVCAPCTPPSATSQDRSKVPHARSPSGCGFVVVEAMSVARLWCTV